MNPFRTPRAFLRASLLLAAVGGAMPASAVTFWFAAVGDATGAPLTNVNVGAAGSTFSLSVWYAETTSHQGADVFVGFDRTADAGATLLDGKLGNASVGNVAPTWDLLQDTQVIAGAGTGTVPYGTDTALFASSSTSTGLGGARMFDVTLSNLSLAVGDSYSILLYDSQGDNDLFGTSYVLDDGGNALRPGGNSALTVTNAVPEPASLAALGLGALAMLRRRRKA